MTFDEHLEQLISLLQREGRITYRALKRRLNVEHDYLADLTGELIDAKRLAADEDGKVLVWTGKNSRESSVQRLASEGQESASTAQTLVPRPSDSRLAAGE